MPFQAPKQEDADAEEGDGGLFAEINITPLTDVVLVLLIIFMVTSSAMVDEMREGKIDVTLPAASTASRDPLPSETLVIGVTAQGQIYVRGQERAVDELKELLAETKKRAPNTMIVLQADGALQHRRVIEVIDLLRESGFNNVGLATETE